VLTIDKRIRHLAMAVAAQMPAALYEEAFEE
jgi:hypothetical protein